MTLSSTGFDTVLQIYRGNSIVNCNDDGVQGQVGPSRASVDITNGNDVGVTLLIQVGGFMGFQDQFTLTADFAVIDDDRDGSALPADCNDTQTSIRPGAPDPLGDGVDQNCDTVDGDINDRDGDGSVVGQDCNDRNAGIRPGATDVPENGVDEDCSGSDAVRLDRDADGFNAPQDCDDNNPAVRPNATDVPGNGADENCDGRDALARLTTGTYAWAVRPDGLTMERLTVRANRGMRITLSCRGRGCFRAIRLTARRAGTVDVLARVPRKRRKRASGNVVVLRLTEPNTIGKVLTLTFRRGQRTKAKNTCSAPNSNRRVKCP